MSLVLPVEISTTDTSEVHSVKALLDCRAISSFIDWDFVCSRGINTQTISWPILVLCHQWIFYKNITWDTLYTPEFSIWVHPRNLLQALRYIKDHQRSLLPNGHQAVTCLIAYTLGGKTDELASGFRDRLSMLML